MTEITITMSHENVGNLLSATAHAIRFAERELSECAPEFPDYREFVEECLEHHRDLNHQFGSIFLRSRPDLSAANMGEQTLRTTNAGSTECDREGD